jgi:hypothetical protein
MLSIILFRSRHLKYASLASQHFARWMRSGAIGAPSEDILGSGSDGEELNRPMAYRLRIGMGEKEVVGAPPLGIKL